MNGETTFSLPANHPACAGHFPGNPIVPGVILLDEAIHAIESATGLALRRIVSVKFFSPAMPGDILLIRHKTLPTGSIRFAVWDGKRQIAAGSLAPSECLAS
jgi:3-hydroxymyristoyl/3-hydroxydecanoyl-(acyl carrier protein) dehydratase